MATYDYIARTTAGESITGVLQAENERAVAHTLDEKKLYPVQIVARASNKRQARRRVRLRDVGVAYGQLSDLLSAGVPLLRALEILSRVGLSKLLTERFAAVREAISAGRTLADAMADHEEVFPPLHTAIVRAGERAGFLEQALANLASLVDQQDELRGRVRGALAYPAFLACFGVIVVTLILIFLVPQYRQLFSEITLPLPSEILFGASDMLRHHLPILLGLFFLAALGIRSVLRSQRGWEMWDRWRLKLPVLGRVLRLVAITRFCRVLGTMLANGVPILQALAIAKDATGSTVLTAGVAAAAENVRAGASLADPLRAGGLFPAEVVEMIAVGEESNQLEKVLVQIADTVERRTNRQVEVAVRLIEPAILLLLAMTIGFVAIGLLYPMLIMSQTLR
jgi:general secretion pathway protein F/type IV pilus assembly protein PilC